MEDSVHYGLPMSLVGQIIHPLLVRPKLEQIFAYRQKRLQEMFGQASGDKSKG